MMLLSGVKRYLTHQVLHYQGTSLRIDELKDRLAELKKEEKKILTHLGYSVYGKGDASKYCRPGKDLLTIEKDMVVVEDLIHAKEQNLKY